MGRDTVHYVWAAGESGRQYYLLGEHAFLSQDGNTHEIFTHAWPAMSGTSTKTTGSCSERYGRCKLLRSQST